LRNALKARRCLVLNFQERPQSPALRWAAFDKRPALGSEKRPESPALSRAAPHMPGVEAPSQPGLELGCQLPAQRPAQSPSRQPNAPGGAGKPATKAAPAHAAPSCFTVRAATRTSLSQSDSWARLAAAAARTPAAKSSCSTPPRPRRALVSGRNAQRAPAPRAGRRGSGQARGAAGPRRAARRPAAAFTLERGAPQRPGRSPGRRPWGACPS